MGVASGGGGGYGAGMELPDEAAGGIWECLQAASAALERFADGEGDDPFDVQMWLENAEAWLLNDAGNGCRLWEWTVHPI